MRAMDKVSSQHIEQNQRLNRSAKAINIDKSLFYLYLSMLEQNIANLPRFADTGSTDEIVYADIESHYYKHPNLQFGEQDFTNQKSFTKAINAKSSQTLHLLNAFFPQGLSRFNNHLRIDDEVLDGLDIYAKQRVSNAVLQNNAISEVLNVIDVDETMLFDLIPKTTEFVF
jgi:hypothetical protein